MNMGLTNDELARRYQAGQPLAQLAVEAGMTIPGVQARLRRIGVPARRQPSRAPLLPKQQIADALDTHRSINAAAKALGITRAALMAEAHRHGLRRTLTPPRDLLDRYHAGATQTQLADHYGVAVSTVGLWLQAKGVTRRRGRRPIDS